MVQAIAPSGNLFLLLLVTELRAQGLTFLAFYVLQRAVREGIDGISIALLRSQTGLPVYEVSRACQTLATADLVKIGKHEKDRRVAVVTRTARGSKIHDQILSAAAERLRKGFRQVGDKRRVDDATALFREGNRRLFDPMMLSFFDLYDMETGKALYPNE
ncbi:MAG TPA: MarR family winged helix-turn-helix transcriptional regulator [Acidobacteriaceae bacterium]|nr:MarR family winged helix-turn-helix transcriptional regulator [Acidobacteriaceae bacterium]